ncbi:hypothetical protein [Frondihabitans sp. PAMC 28766]|uniref:tetratricopeptide repeat protein n=1 Tax=Frondihabitans sp. PAMC 28766 TaxID=1795630 RepID=UPI0012FF9AC9|nr:hypothetical protein [Frondihabitans sp. PAMC 28766]
MTTQGASATRDDDDVTIAQLCLDLGRPKEAHRILTKLTGQGDVSHATVLLMAEASLQVRATRASLEWARKAVQADPSNEWAWRLVAASASRNRDHHEALKAALTAIDLAPGNWVTHAQRVEVDIENNRVTEDTWDAAQEAVALAPNEPGALLVSARLAHSKGFIDGAETFYREVLRLDPAHAYAKRQLAQVKLDSNKLGDATAAFAEMLAENPGSRIIARRLRRAVLRSLDWVNGILLSGLMLVGLIAAMSIGSSHLSGGVRGAIAGVGVLMIVGLALAWRRYRRGLGQGGSDFLRRLPRLSPGLVVLAAFQAVVLLSTVVLIVLLVASVPGLGAVLAGAAIIASALVFVCLVYAGVMRAVM